MKTLETILIVSNVLTLILYFTSKFKESCNLSTVIKEVKEDIKNSSKIVADLVTKATDIVFDETVKNN